LASIAQKEKGRHESFASAQRALHPIVDFIILVFISVSYFDVRKHELAN
jgi:hypothetical protein